MRCPIAAGCILASLRRLPIRTTTSRSLGMEPVSENNTFPPASSAWNLASSLPIDSASPETSLSVPAEPTRYNPNLSEEEPLFSARTFNSGSASVMRCPAEASLSGGPAPVANFRHVVAVLADIELMALHGRPVARGRPVELIAEAWNTPDGVQRQLIAVEIVQHHHIEGRCGGALLPVATHMNIVVIVPPVGQLVHHRGIAMESEDHRRVGREKPIEILIPETMGMLGSRLQHHQIHHVDDADANIRGIPAKKGHGSERL